MDPAVLGFWMQSDAVGRLAALVLLSMSLACWTIIATRGASLWRMRREKALIAAEFRAADDITTCMTRLRAVAASNPCTHIAENAVATLELLDAGTRRTPLQAETPSELLARSMRRAMTHCGSRREAGLSVLASVGATAPFVGLFGTVWGIYHALSQIGLSGQASIDKVAGPVGEALIMTASGIAVAVPAVLAYNVFCRANRMAAADLESFAQDVHGWLISGVKLPVMNGVQGGSA
jgi:biopolymer transport protein ExbB